MPGCVAVVKKLPLLVPPPHGAHLPGTMAAIVFLISSGRIAEFLAEPLPKVDHEGFVPILHLNALAKQSKYNNT